MANNCYVNIVFTHKTKEACDKHMDWLVSRKQEASRDNMRMFYGADERWLDDADIMRMSDVSISLTGDVRWALELWDFAGAVKAANPETLVSADATYEECGNGVYGTYHYADGKFCERMLPDEYWPEPEDELFDEELDDWYDTEADRLEAVLSEHGVDGGPYTAEAVEEKYKAYVAWRESVGKTFNNLSKQEENNDDK